MEGSVNQGTLMLFEPVQAAGGSQTPPQPNGNRTFGGSGTRIFYTDPTKSPLPRYLEDFFGEASHLDRAVSAKCNECGSVVKGSYGVTSNFLRHLRQRHPYLEIQNPGRPYQANSNNSNNDQVVVVNYSSSSLYNEGMTTPFKTTASSSLLQDIQVFSHPRQRSLAESILKWITMDMLPFSIVEDKGFNSFCRTFESTYTNAPVTRQILYRMLTSKVNGEIVPSLKTAMSSTDDGSLHVSVDVWTKDVHQPGLFAVKVHFINEKWEMVRRTLGLAPIESMENETENLLPNCAATLGQYGIELNKVGTITTGHAWQLMRSALAMRGLGESQEGGEAADALCKQEPTNYADEEGDDPLSAEFECLQAEHLPSIVESLQRIAERSIKASPTLRKVMESVNAILNYTKADPRFLDELRDHLTSKLSLPLRKQYNTQLDLLQWLSEDEVVAALSNALLSVHLQNEEGVNLNSIRARGFDGSPPEMPTQEMRNEAKLIYTHFLSPLSEAIDTLQANGALSSLVIPAMCGIVEAINSVKDLPELNNLAEDITLAIVGGIQNGRSREIREHEIFVLATILDPRFKVSVFPAAQTPESALIGLPSRTEAIRLLKEAYQGVNFVDNEGKEVACLMLRETFESPANVPQSVEITGAQDLVNKKIFSFYMDKPAKKARQETEVESYLSEDPNPTFSPLSYWRVKNETYPRLAALAKRVLSIPTCQGSPEKLSAAATDLDKAYRTNIELEVMEAMVIYRENITNIC